MLATSRRSPLASVACVDPRESGQASGKPVPPVSVCSFCNGEPIVDAAGWADGRPRVAPCPRCGQVGGKDAA